MVHSFQLPSLLASRALMSMFGCNLPVVVGGDQQHNSCTAVSSAAQYGDNLTGCSHTDQAGSPSAVDAALFGINLKANGLHQHRMSSLIEKR